MYKKVELLRPPNGYSRKTLRPKKGYKNLKQSHRDKELLNKEMQSILKCIVHILYMYL